MKLSKDFYYVPKGEVYPVTAKSGEAVPAGFEDICKSIGIVETEKQTLKPAVVNKQRKPKLETK